MLFLYFPIRSIVFLNLFFIDIAKYLAYSVNVLNIPYGGTPIVIVINIQVILNLSNLKEREK